MNARLPATGRSASAACAAVSTLVMPLTCSVAAVVTMMKNATMLEKIIPIQVSVAMWLKWPALSAAFVCEVFACEFCSCEAFSCEVLACL